MTASLGEPSSHWHSIRPWSPRFLLTVREITSVSTTFVLSSTCSSDGTDTSLASLGITPGSASDDEDSPENALPGLTSSRSYLLSDALDALGRGRGLSVNVNGANWKRVLMRPNDKGDEAILVIYGLMPGRQYDVEIGIVFGDGEEVLHSRMVTQPQRMSHPRPVRNTVSLTTINIIYTYIHTYIHSRSISKRRSRQQLRRLHNTLNQHRPNPLPIHLLHHPIPTHPLPHPRRIRLPTSQPTIAYRQRTERPPRRAQKRPKRGPQGRRSKTQRDRSSQTGVGETCGC